MAISASGQGGILVRSARPVGPAGGDHEGPVAVWGADPCPAGSGSAPRMWGPSASWPSGWISESVFAVVARKGLGHPPK